MIMFIAQLLWLIIGDALLVIDDHGSHIGIYQAAFFKPLWMSGFVALKVSTLEIMKWKSS